MTGQGPPAQDQDPDDPSQYGEGSLNTGVPASSPPGPSPWGDDGPWAPPDPGRAERGQPAPERFAPPDPAAVSGPPWPRLVAEGGYQAPPMLRWPIAVVLVAAVAGIVYLVAFSSSSGAADLTTSHRDAVAAAFLPDLDGTATATYGPGEVQAEDAPGSSSSRAWAITVAAVADASSATGSRGSVGSDRVPRNVSDT